MGKVRNGTPPRILHTGSKRKQLARTTRSSGSGGWGRVERSKVERSEPPDELKCWGLASLVTPHFARPQPPGAPRYGCAVDSLRLRVVLVGMRLRGSAACIDWPDIDESVATNAVVPIVKIHGRVAVRRNQPDK